MRARPPRVLAAIVSAVVAIIVAVGILAAPTDAHAAPADAVRLEVLRSEATGLDRAIGLAGAPHRIAVTVALTNDGPTRQRAVVAWVETSASVAATSPVDLAPGQTRTARAVVQVSGLPGTAHHVVVSTGTATAAVTHRQVPWLLIGAAAIGIHVVALSARDRVRRRLAHPVARAVAQPSPSQTWARSSR